MNTFEQFGDQHNPGGSFSALKCRRGPQARGSRDVMKKQTVVVMVPKGLDDIRRWVTENFPPTDSLNEFVLNIPLAVLDLISAGVNNFKGIRDAEDDDIETEIAD
jgi:hypothetical protein